MTNVKIKVVKINYKAAKTKPCTLTYITELQTLIRTNTLHTTFYQYRFLFDRPIFMHCTSHAFTIETFEKPSPKVFTT